MARRPPRLADHYRYLEIWLVSDPERKKYFFEVRWPETGHNLAPAFQDAGYGFPAAAILGARDWINRTYIQGTLQRNPYRRNADVNFRQLERQARATGSIDDTHAFLIAAYRAGLYRPPFRYEIKRILRHQVKHYRGTRSFSPRYYYPDEGKKGRNASKLQHPGEVKLWGGNYGEWNDALRDALPGEVFEVSVYYIPDGDLDGVIPLEVPESVFIFNNHIYGPPPDFASCPRYSSKKMKQLAQAALDIASLNANYGEASHGMCVDCFQGVIPAHVLKSRNEELRAHGITVYCAWCKRIIYDPNIDQIYRRNPDQDDLDIDYFW
jgi:hypothetical protein